MTTQFWNRVRLFNWIAGGVGLIGSLVYLSQPKSVVRQPEHSVFTAAFSPDGQRLLENGLAVSGYKAMAELRAWDTAAGQRLWSLPLPGTRYTQTAIMPDSRSFVVVVNGPDETSSPSPSGSVFPVPTVAPGSCVLQFRDLSTGRLLRTSQPITQLYGAENLHSVDVAPTGTAAVVTTWNQIVFWEANGAGAEQRWVPHAVKLRDSERKDLAGAQFTADGRRLVVTFSQFLPAKPTADSASRPGTSGTSGTSETYRVWTRTVDARTGKEVASVGPWFGKLSNQSCLLSPDRHYLLYKAPQQSGTKLTLADVETGKIQRQFSVPASLDNPFRFLPVETSRWRHLPTVYPIVVGDRNVFLWDAATNALERRVDPPAPYRHPSERVVYAPDGERVAVLAHPGFHYLARICDVRTGKLLQTLK